jgi:hypothetical protein
MISYDSFAEEANKIFADKNKCYKNNVIKFSEECQFKNNYTHGGYQCGEDGTWSNVCVPAYCDMGYRFDQKNKKCVKDVCSSVIVPDDPEEGGEGKEDPKKKEEKGDSGSSSFVLYAVLIGVGALILIFIIVFCVVQCRKKRVSSRNIDVDMEFEK